MFDVVWPDSEGNCLSFAEEARLVLRRSPLGRRGVRLDDLKDIFQLGDYPLYFVFSFSSGTRLLQPNAFSGGPFKNLLAFPPVLHENRELHLQRMKE